jgi:hypothetical protein
MRPATVTVSHYVGPAALYRTLRARSADDDVAAGFDRTGSISNVRQPLCRLHQETWIPSIPALPAAL